jgi:hypothetical protein
LAYSFGAEESQSRCREDHRQFQPLAEHRRCFAISRKDKKARGFRPESDWLSSLLKGFG